MKTNRLIFLAAMLVVGFVSCDRQSEVERPVVNDALKFNATINALTRATDITWDSGDPIGIYMVSAGQTLADGSVLAANKQHTTVGTGSFTPANPATDAIQLPESGNVDFIAYYRYAATVTDYKIPVDVSVQTNPAAIDLMYATKTGVANTATSVDLAFDHKLTKITFNITDQSGSNLAGLATKLSGLKTVSSFSLADAGLTDDDGSVADITAVTSVSGQTAKASAIILPSSGTAGFKVNFANSSVSFTYDFQDGTQFAGGSHYAYNVNISADGIISVTGSINPWTEVPGLPDIDFDLDDNEIVTPPGDYYTTGTLASFDPSAYGFPNAAGTYNQDTPLNSTSAGDILGTTATIVAYGGSEGGKVAYGDYTTEGIQRGYLITKGWVSTALEDHGWLVTLPLTKKIETGKTIDLTFHSYGSATSASELTCEFSTDNLTWDPVGDYDNTTVSTEKNVTITLPAEVDSPNIYFRLRARSVERINPDSSDPFATTGTTRVSDMVFELK